MAHFTSKSPLKSFCRPLFETLRYSNRLHLSLDFTQKINIGGMYGANTVFSFQMCLNCERKKKEAIQGFKRFGLEHKLYNDQSECHIVY